MSFSDLEIEESGDFLKLKAGEPIKFHILSESPSKEVVHWINKKKEKCQGKFCEHCQGGNKPKQRWTVDVWDRKTLAIKKLEFGPMIAGQLKSIDKMMKENGQTIKDTDIRIETTGSDLETEYNSLPVPIPINSPIPKDVIDQYVPF